MAHERLDLYVHLAGADERPHDETLARIFQLLETTMSKISDFVTAQTAFNQTISDGVDAIVAATNENTTAVAGLTTDIAALNKTIADLQASGGSVTPEDQALLDTAQAQGKALAAKVSDAAAAAKASADAAAALDAQTPPVPPAA